MDNTYSTKVYKRNGGDEMVVASGGKITVEAGGELNVAGVEFTQAANQADSTASDVAGLVTDFNALLAKLQAAGLMAGS